jgi:hypothetical protein
MWCLVGGGNRRAQKTGPRKTAVKLKGTYGKSTGKEKLGYEEIGFEMRMAREPTEVRKKRMKILGEGWWWGNEVEESGGS